MEKTLKDQYLWKIWAIIAANSLFFYGVIQTNAIELNGVRALFTGPHSLTPVGIAVVIATVLNWVLGPDAKARIVFLRWHYPLPGHRAFSKYGKSDTRVDLPSLATIIGTALPTDPREQNRVWYRMYKTVENFPKILQLHRDFLLLRDYTGLSVLFVLVFGSIGLYKISSLKVSEFYLLILFVPCLSG